MNGRPRWVPSETSIASLRHPELGTRSGCGIGLLFLTAARRAEAGQLWTSPLSLCCSPVTVGAY